MVSLPFLNFMVTHMGFEIISQVRAGATANHRQIRPVIRLEFITFNSVSLNSITFICLVKDKSKRIEKQTINVVLKKIAGEHPKLKESNDVPGSGPAHLHAIHVV